MLSDIVNLEMMVEKIRTLAWFARRPSHWAHAFALAKRKLAKNYDSPERRRAATDWAAERAVPVDLALAAMGLNLDGVPLPRIDSALLTKAAARAEQSSVKMGGAGDLDLLYATTRLCGARTVIETGVAYGWSSLAILSGQGDCDDARLISVDMPYPKMNNESFVGIVIPEQLRVRWTLIREPDRNGIRRAISLTGKPLDLVHYDSDKSYQGRHYAYPILWKALRKGGIFISDDIQDNVAFRDFVMQKNVPYAITASQGKYVGIVRKT